MKEVNFTIKIFPSGDELDGSGTTDTTIQEVIDLLIKMGHVEEKDPQDNIIHYQARIKKNGEKEFGKLLDKEKSIGFHCIADEDILFVHPRIQAC